MIDGVISMTTGHLDNLSGLIPEGYLEQNLKEVSRWTAGLSGSRLMYTTHNNESSNSQIVINLTKKICTPKAFLVRRELHANESPNNQKLSNLFSWNNSPTLTTTTTMIEREHINQQYMLNLIVIIRKRRWGAGVG